MRSDSSARRGSYPRYALMTPCLEDTGISNEKLAHRGICDALRPLALLEIHATESSGSQAAGNSPEYYSRSLSQNETLSADN